MPSKIEWGTIVTLLLAIISGAVYLGSLSQRVSGLENYVQELRQDLKSIRDSGSSRSRENPPIPEGRASEGNDVKILNFDEEPLPIVTRNDKKTVIDDIKITTGEYGRAIEWRMPGGYQELRIPLPQEYDLTVVEALQFRARASTQVQVEVQLKDRDDMYTTKNQKVLLKPAWDEFKLPIQQFTMQSGFDATRFQQIVFWFKDGSDEKVIFTLDDVWILRK